MEGRLKKIGNEYKLYAQDDSCIATSWYSPYQRLSKNNCQAIVNGYDLDELLDGLLINRGEHPSRVRNPLYGEERQLAKDLVQKALEILGDKKFSEFLDKEKELGISDIKTIERIQWYYKTYFDKSQQTEWDCVIFVDEKTKQPLLDNEGTLILKRK